MNVNTAAITLFMHEHEGVYPFNVIPQTRRGYYPKWLLGMSINTDGIVKRKIGYYVIKSSCLNRENIQKLIMDGDGIPLPTDFAEVIDSLETWGCSKYYLWLQKSLFLMHGYLIEDNVHGGVPPKKMRLFHDCILPIVEWLAKKRFVRGSADFNTVVNNWATCHWVRCNETFSFQTLLNADEILDDAVVGDRDQIVTA